MLPALALCTLACGQAPDYAPPAATAEPATSTPTGPQLDQSAGDQAAACAGVAVAAEPLPVDLFAVVDGSSSMDEATSSGVSKWSATKAAFGDFLAHAPSGMRFGLSLFPATDSGAASCAPEQYRDAALPMDVLTQMAPAALARLDAVIPHGQTPTAPAFTAALELATSYALDHADRSVVVVLATDGMPTLCAPTDAAALAALAKAALTGPGHVRTLVVALPSQGDDTVAAGLEPIALAGGTEHALALAPHADFSRQLSNALSATAARQVACDLAVPEPPPGQHLDYDAVNVVLDGKSRVTLPRVSGPDDCSVSSGWYYDVDPARGAPARINLCKSACSDVSSAEKLQVELGCSTLVR